MASSWLGRMRGRWVVITTGRRYRRDLLEAARDARLAFSEDVQSALCPALHAVLDEYDGGRCGRGEVLARLEHLTQA